MVDKLFSTVAGALGWHPDIIMDTPIPQLILAIEGKLDFVIKTNPFGAGKKESEKSKPKVDKAKQRADQERQALKFDMMMLTARQKAQGKVDGSDEA